MINQLLKWSVILAIWKKYGSAIKVLPLLLLVILLVYAVHGDYIEYAEVSEEKQHLALSFLVKWLAILGVIAAYWLYLKKALKSNKNKKPSLKDRLKKRKAKGDDNAGSGSGRVFDHAADTDQPSSEREVGIKKRLHVTEVDVSDVVKEARSQTESFESGSKNGEVTVVNSDPFKNLRQKKYLRSEAEWIIEKKPKPE